MIPIFLTKYGKMRNKEIIRMDISEAIKRMQKIRERMHFDFATKKEIEMLEVKPEDVYVGAKFIKRFSGYTYHIGKDKDPDKYQAWCQEIVHNFSGDRDYLAKELTRMGCFSDIEIIGHSPDTNFVVANVNKVRVEIYVVNMQAVTTHNVPMVVTGTFLDDNGHRKNIKPEYLQTYFESITGRPQLVTRVTNNYWNNYWMISDKGL